MVAFRGLMLALTTTTAMFLSSASNTDTEIDNNNPNAPAMDVCLNSPDGGGTCEMARTATAEAGDCVDSHPDCNRLDRLDCLENYRKHSVECPQTCGLCNSDKQDTEEVSAVQNLYSWEFPQALPGTAEERQATRKLLLESDSYMQDIYRQEGSDARWTCANRHPKCSNWAAKGECERNPDYMRLHCQPACQACSQPKIGCETNLTQSVWKAGDLDRTFQHIIDNYKTAMVHSRPPNGPWLITIDDFLSPEQCEFMIEIASDIGYEKSTTGGADATGKSVFNDDDEHRTSSTMWCTVKSCRASPVVKKMRGKIYELVRRIPANNFEDLQMLRYYPPQYYKEHHDYIASHIDRPEGVRILTVFLYLNDVAEGGGTRFTMLNKTITPKRGRMVIWPSVQNEFPHRIDNRTHHEALPVVRGVKYASNAWIHQRDFANQLARHC